MNKTSTPFPSGAYSLTVLSTAKSKVNMPAPFKGICNLVGKLADI